MLKFSNANQRFSFVASTGRTATTFIAKYLNSFEGITGLHEGTLLRHLSCNQACLG